MRKAGVLLHLSSLPGDGCIGTMGREARDFVDFLHDAGQSVWQVLPLNPPAVCDSPYAAYSAFGGNPYLIDLPGLEAEGLLPPGSAAALAPQSFDAVDYGLCHKAVVPLLRQAFQRDTRREEIGDFRQRHRFWIEDYALYMAIRTKLGDISYQDWPPTLSGRIPKFLDAARRGLREQVDFWVYVQFLFFRQWLDLKGYANARGVEIIGDMPIYPAQGSADVWANPDIFLLDERQRPRLVAGVPPDAFTEDGQLWGNPLYNWDVLKRSGYRWWVERLRIASTLYDAVRLDHFRALDEFYAIPAGDSTARDGVWMPGPGMDFFRAVRHGLPGCNLIAEDLGVITGTVEALLRESGLPGMKVLLFAFDGDPGNPYLPHNHIPHCVAYLGTHDNDTAAGWAERCPDEAARAAKYLGFHNAGGSVSDWLRGLYASVAGTAVVQMQDILGLGNSARMNIPGTAEGNWRWRLPRQALTPALSASLREITERYGRLPPE